MPEKTEKTLKYEPGVGIRFTELARPEQSAKQQEKEKLPEELIVERTQAVEQKTEELVADGRQQVENIEKEISLPEEEIISAREEVKISENLEKVTNNASVLENETKQKLSNLGDKNSENPPQEKVSQLENKEVLRPDLAEGIEKDPRVESIKEDLIKDWEQANGNRYDKSGVLRGDFQNFLYGDPTDWKRGRKPISVEQRTQKIFAERFPDDARAYAEKEKTRIYESAADDPAVKEVEETITRLTNQQAGNPSGRNYRDIWSRNFDHISMQQWDDFLSRYPEKAAGYKDKFSSIKEAFEGQERLRQHLERKEIEKQRELERPKTIEDDQTFRSFMDNEIDGLNARVWRGISRAEGLTGQQYDEKAKIIKEQMDQEFISQHPDLAFRYGLKSEESKKEEESEMIKQKVVQEFQKLQEEEEPRDFDIVEQRMPWSIEKSRIEPVEKRPDREINESLIAEARSQRDKLLEGRGLLQMSKADFGQYFASKDFEIRTDLQQGNIGDCYVVAAIHAMSRSPHFEMIVRSSMKRLPDGSWEVRIPLLSKGSDIIKITPEELLPQKNRQFLKREKGNILPDLRRKLLPMKGKEGLQVLEAAFMKQKFGTVDRLAAEGGWGDQVLMELGGDNLKRLAFNAGYTVKEGKAKFAPEQTLDTIPNQKYLDDFLNNFDPEVDMATVATRFFDKNKLTGQLADALGLLYKTKGANKFFVPGHAYSISKVDRQKKIVTVNNPWNTTKPIDLTFDQFKGTFQSIGAARIDHSKLLKNIEVVTQKQAA